MAISREQLDQAITDRFIKPSERPSEHRIGLEFEFPIVNLRKEPVCFDTVHELTDLFISHFQFSNASVDDDGFIYCAEDPSTGDTISFDCSYNTLEFSFGTEKDLHIIFSRFKKYYGFVQDFLLPHGHTLTGMGINPHRQYNRVVPIHNDRYRMLLHHLRSYRKYTDEMDFHDLPSFGLFSCASQIQIDLEKEHMPEVLNAFNRLEPFKAALFANSPLHDERFGDFLCSRDFLWQNSLHGLNPENVGMYEKRFETPEDIRDYIAGESIYCLHRDGKYLNFRPVPLSRYFESENITGEYFDGKEYRTYTFSPEITDLSDFRSFKFEDVTFRGTVEFRSVCEQPVSDIMTCAAFHVGLMQNVQELSELIGQDSFLYRDGYDPITLRKAFCRDMIPSFVSSSELKQHLLAILELSKKGLLARDLGEETFLEPLFTRAECLTNPAAAFVKGLEEGVSVDYFIKKYS